MFRRTLRRDTTALVLSSWSTQSPARSIAFVPRAIRVRTSEGRTGGGPSLPAAFALTWLEFAGPEAASAAGAMTRPIASAAGKTALMFMCVPLEARL